MGDMTIRKTGGDLVCPHCQAYLDVQAYISGPPEPMKNGNITICSQCARASILRDDHLVLLSKKEVAALNKADRTKLKLTILAVMQRNAQLGGDSN